MSWRQFVEDIWNLVVPERCWVIRHSTNFPYILFASMTWLPLYPVCQYDLWSSPGSASVERSPWSACGQLNSKKCCWTLISSRNLSQCLVINIKHNFLTSNFEHLEGWKCLRFIPWEEQMFVLSSRGKRGRSQHDLRGMTFIPKIELILFYQGPK